jgi:hypothetical protein
MVLLVVVSKRREVNGSLLLLKSERWTEKEQPAPVVSRDAQNQGTRPTSLTLLLDARLGLGNIEVIVLIEYVCK